MHHHHGRETAIGSGTRRDLLQEWCLQGCLYRGPVPGYTLLLLLECNTIHSVTLFPQLIFFSLFIIFLFYCFFLFYLFSSFTYSVRALSVLRALRHRPKHTHTTVYTLYPSQSVVHDTLRTFLSSTRRLCTGPSGCLTLYLLSQMLFSAVTSQTS